MNVVVEERNDAFVRQAAAVLELVFVGLDKILVVRPQLAPLGRIGIA